MGWKPQLNAVCGRCGRSHGLFATCVARGARKRPLKLRVSYGKCPRCRRGYGPGGALTHACAPKSDFGRRKKQFEAEQAKREREEARKARPKHDYTECGDGECKRPLCVAYKAGRELGDTEGYARGWDHGHARGVADCPRDHKLGVKPVSHALVVLVIAAAYILFTLASPTRACKSCGRQRGPCPRCQGTGRRFRPGARLVHRGAATAWRHARRGR